MITNIISKKLPNFIIVGSAKSGTTSLYKYMNQHPDAFIPTVKEPNYFVNNHEMGTSVIKNKDDYTALFNCADETAIGEASTAYLYFPETAQKIKNSIPNCKILAIIRNPVDRAFSMWGHQVREGLEKKSFDDAINEELRGIIRKSNQVTYGFNYYELGFTSNLLLSYQQLFGKQNVLVLNYEDLSNAPDKLMKRVFQFLNIDDKFVGDWSGKYNISGKPKYSILHNALNSKSIIKKTILLPFKIFLTKNMRGKLWNMIRDWNIRSGKEHKMHKETRSKLQNLYRNEIISLEKIMGSDLSHWMETPYSKRS